MKDTSFKYRVRYFENEERILDYPCILVCTWNIRMAKIKMLNQKYLTKFFELKIYFSEFFEIFFLNFH